MATTIDAKAFLGEIRTRLSSLHGGKFRRAVLTNFAEEARRLVLLSFQNSTEPGGVHHWRYSMRNGRPQVAGQILRDTGRLQNSIVPRATATGVRIESNVAYAAIHNYGGSISRSGQTLFRYRGKFISARRYIKATERAARTFEDTGRRSRSEKRYQAGRSKASTIRIPRRQFLPDTKLPPRWVAALQRVADQVMTTAMGQPAPSTKGAA